MHEGNSNNTISVIRRRTYLEEIHPVIIWTQRIVGLDQRFIWQAAFENLEEAEFFELYSNGLFF